MLKILTVLLLISFALPVYANDFCTDRDGTRLMFINNIDNVDKHCQRAYMDKSSIKANYEIFKSRNCDIKVIDKPTNKTFGEVQISCPEGFVSYIIGLNARELKVTAFRGDIYNKNTVSYKDKKINNVNQNVISKSIVSGYYNNFRPHVDSNIYHGFFNNYLLAILTTDCGQKEFYANVVEAIDDFAEESVKTNEQEKAEKAELERLMKKYDKTDKTKKDVTPKKKFGGSK